jgi:threonine synthase
MSGGPVRDSLPIGDMTLFPVRALRAVLGTPSRRVAHETYGPTASNEDRATGPLVIEDGLRHGPETVTPASMGNTTDATEFGAAAAGMRASLFVFIDRQEEKSTLMTQTGAAVFGLPVSCPQTAEQPMMTMPARVLPIQSHQSVPIWATTKQTEE